MVIRRGPAGAGGEAAGDGASAGDGGAPCAAAYFLNSALLGRCTFPIGRMMTSTFCGDLCGSIGRPVCDEGGVAPRGATGGSALSSCLQPRAASESAAASAATRGSFRIMAEI